MIVTKTPFGTLQDGRIAMLFQFKTSNGLQIRISNFGAAIISVKYPDKSGNSEEVTAGFPQLGPYLQGHPYFGVVVGRFANRIAGGTFSIDGKPYSLACNNGPNHLHGGPQGFHTKLWDYSLLEKQDEAHLTLRYFSPDMEEGYPGNMEAEVTYVVADNNKVDICYKAQTDQATHVNLTNHAYFNLSGFRENIQNHCLKLHASHYLEINEHQIPTGKLIPCQDTPMDFSKNSKLANQGMPVMQELDHCFVLEEDRDWQTLPAAVLHHPQSGRRIQVFCSQPGIQVYTSNFLDGSLRGHNGMAYAKHSAICLETQHFPDSPNQPHFPSTLLLPGQQYNQTTRMIFDNH
ncbi:MAG: aldose epimerase family protein [Bacteroidales bacterium]